jgi:hypothetical protein
MFFVGPSTEVDVAAAFATKGSVFVSSLVAARATTLGAHDDANLSVVHGLNAKSHFKRHIV